MICTNAIPAGITNGPGISAAFVSLQGRRPLAGNTGIPYQPAAAGPLGMQICNKGKVMGKAFAYESNATDHWLTPPDLLQALGGFDLDPCAYHTQPWQSAAKHYALPENDGLLLPWHGRVWCNPPYGKETGRWVDRMALHSNGIMLIFGRYETEGFRPAWKYADAIYWLYKRVAFYLPSGSLPEDGGGTAPSLLIAFGKQNIDSLRALQKTKWKGALTPEIEPGF